MKNNEKKTIIPMKNVRYSDFYFELYQKNYELIVEQDLLEEFSQMFWCLFKKEMTEKDIKKLFDDLEDHNYHRERKILIETMPSNDEELNNNQGDKIEWQGLDNYYCELFESMFQNNMQKYGNNITDSEKHTAFVTKFVEMFWNSYKDKMSTIDVELLLDYISDNNYKTAYKILLDMIKKDNRETSQHIPIEAFKDENIQNTIDEYINKYGYTYYKLMEALFENNNEEDLETVFSDCGLDGFAYYYPNPEIFEKIRNYYMNEYRRTK